MTRGGTQRGRTAAVHSMTSGGTQRGRTAVVLTSPTLHSSFFLPSLCRPIHKMPRAALASVRDLTPTQTGRG